MKKMTSIYNRARVGIKAVLIVTAVVVVIQSCKKDPFSFQVATRSVLMLDMIQKDTSLSIAVQALEKAKMAATLNTYGPFTFFVPDNNGFRKLFTNLGKTGLQDFTEEEIRTIMTYHILPTRLKAAEFIQGPQATATGRGDYITLDISKGYKSNTIANGKANVYQTDIEYSNGYVHKMDGVLDPPTLTIGQFMLQNADKYSIMIAGLQKAGFMDTLTALDNSSGTRIRLTLFAETNDVLQAAGIQNFDHLTLDSLKSFMQYHIIPGGNFSSSYTKFVTSIPGLNVVERWDSTILTLDRQQWLYFDLAAVSLVNNKTNLAASDIIMRNGIIHNLEKHITFAPTIKRTQIYHTFWNATTFCYGIPGFTSSQPPVANASSGNWRWYTEGKSATNHPRGANFLFMNPDGINDSLVTVVRNVRMGKYRIEVNYKSGGRGDYQMMHESDPIGVPTNYGIAPVYEQKVVIGTYEFKSSGDKRIRFVCTRTGGINLEAMVLTPVYN
jgi:uncharacterized surface protein with fasciclin (FAS1) repeats